MRPTRPRSSSPSWSSPAAASWPAPTRSVAPVAAPSDRVALARGRAGVRRSGRPRRRPPRSPPVVADPAGAGRATTGNAELDRLLPTLPSVLFEAGAHVHFGYNPVDCCHAGGYNPEPNDVWVSERALGQHRPPHLRHRPRAGPQRAPPTRPSRRAHRRGRRCAGGASRTVGRLGEGRRLRRVGALPRERRRRAASPTGAAPSRGDRRPAPRSAEHGLAVRSFAAVPARTRSPIASVNDPTEMDRGGAGSWEPAPPCTSMQLH